jgi:hypothetical protein
MTRTKTGSTMAKPRPKVKIPKACSRCRRRLTSREQIAGMALFNDGYIEGLSCANCLTLEEVGHCAWLEATTEAGLNTDGRILVRTKKFPEVTI